VLSVRKIIRDVLTEIVKRGGEHLFVVGFYFTMMVNLLSLAFSLIGHAQPSCEGRHLLFNSPSILTASNLRV
jgi:hypothetical protein